MGQGRDHVTLSFTSNRDQTEGVVVSAPRDALEAERGRDRGREWSIAGISVSIPFPGNYAVSLWLFVPSPHREIETEIEVAINEVVERHGWTAERMVVTTVE